MYECQSDPGSRWFPGAAFLAGLAIGFWELEQEIAALWQAERRFEPAIGADQRAALMAKWDRVVSRSLGWAKPA